MSVAEHRCEWRDQAEALQVQLDQANVVIGSLTEKLAEATAVVATMQTQVRDSTAAVVSMSEQMAAMKGTVEKLQRHVFGQRSEKIPPLASEIRDPERAERERISALQKRRENQEKKRKLTTRRIEHKVPEDRKVCPKCGGHDFSKLGGGLATELFDLVRR